MKPTAPAPAASPAAIETPGLPGLRTWRAVYIFIGVSLVLYIVALTVLTHVYS